MDDYLDLLIDSSALSAKASLLEAMMPVVMPTTLSKALKQNLTSDDLDEAIAMCAVMDDVSLRATAQYISASLVSPTDDFRDRVLYGAAILPTINSFSQLDSDVAAIVDHVLTRKPKDVPLVVSLAVARGACIKFLATGAEDDDAVDDCGMIWLGTRHEMIAPIAMELKAHGSSDPILVTNLLSEASRLLEV